MKRASAMALLLLAASPTPALAHSAARGFVLLLPVTHVIVGGALAVLVSFLVVAMLPARVFRIEPGDRTMAHGPSKLAIATSLASLGVVLILLLAGVFGSPDPAENLLPLAVWTLWWVVIVLLHPLLGNLWSWLNPFTGLHALLPHFARPPLRYPGWASYWPAVAVFFAFAWFELVYPSPADPTRLAIAVAVYAIATFAAVLLFGPSLWLGRGDPFAVFLSQLGAAAPFGPGGRLRLPGLGLASLGVLPLSGMVFVLLSLSSISFDGFASTFTWLGLAGVNPLDYPGRTAMMAANTLGLVLSFLLLVCAYAIAVTAGWLWAGRPGDLRSLLCRLVFSLIPISIAYHLAHFLGDALINIQYLALALNDPLESGANLLGLAGRQVTASYLNTAAGALAIFSAQTAAIVIGHFAGVGVAHAIALQAGLAPRHMLKLEAPLAVFMVIYTAFGLWLLATPSIA